MFSLWTLLYLWSKEEEWKAWGNDVGMWSTGRAAWLFFLSCTSDPRALRKVLYGWSYFTLPVLSQIMGRWAPIRWGGLQEMASSLIPLNQIESHCNFNFPESLQNFLSLTFPPTFEPPMPTPSPNLLAVLMLMVGESKKRMRVCGQPYKFYLSSVNLI